MRVLILLLGVLSTQAFAGQKYLKNDSFNGTGAVYSGISFREYEGAGVAFHPSASDYPLKIVAIDVFAVSYGGGNTGAIGQYLVEVWNQAGSVSPARNPDGGYAGLLADSFSNIPAFQLTASTTMLNRITLPTPLIIPSGDVFVMVSEQLDTATDGTTIALDSNTSTPVAGANWMFNGAGGFDSFNLPDGGVLHGGNWVIRLVLEVPDAAVTVNAILPASGPSSVNVPVVVTGTNFEVGAHVLLNGTIDLALSQASATSLSATVPAGTAPGVYDVVVKNPSGTQGTLPQGYRVLSDGTGGGTGAGGGTATGGGSGTGGGTTSTLTLTDITPAQAYAGDDTTLIVTGTGFQTGAQLIIGTKTLDADVKSAAVINATLKANTLGKGVYDVTVINLDGSRASLPMAFSVNAGSSTKSGCGCTSFPTEFALLALGALGLRRRRDVRGSGRA